jgi:exonuclease SbcD
MLHTSDWHVGRKMRGRSRAEEHRAVLAEIADVARDRDIEAVIVAGDMFDSGAPDPESEDIVYRALLDLATATGAVVAVAGNHDSASRLSAVRPLLLAAGVHCAPYPERAAEGGVLTLKPGNEEVRFGLLPFVSQRAIVKVAQLLEQSGADFLRTYELRMKRILDDLSTAFAKGAVNVVVAHNAVVGAGPAGSERPAHIFDYYVQASTFPSSANYVALGHFHGCQQVPGPGLLWYSGSPLQLDFGEAEQQKHVLIVDAKAGVPATVERVPLASGRRLRNIRATEQEILFEGLSAPDDWLRVIVEGPRRAGMADELRAQLPNLVDIRLAEVETPERRPQRSSTDRPAEDRFADYLAERNAGDERVLALFKELAEEAGAPETA